MPGVINVFSKVTGNGRGLIDSAIGAFTAIKEDLAVGISLCEKEIVKQEEIIVKAADEKALHEESIAKAKKLSDNLTKLLS